MIRLDTYIEIRDEMKKYNHELMNVCGHTETFKLESINLIITIHSYSDFVGFKTIKNKYSIDETASFYIVENNKTSKVRVVPMTTNEAIIEFKNKLKNAILIAQAELEPLGNFSIKKETDTYRLTLDNSGIIPFTDILVLKELDEVALVRKGEVVAHFKKNEAKKVLWECANIGVDILERYKR